MVFIVFPIIAQLSNADGGVVADVVLVFVVVTLHHHGLRRMRPVSGTCIEFGPTSSVPLSLYSCLHWIPRTNCNHNPKIGLINQHSQVYLCFTNNIAF